jgi:hypothetical protein
MIVQEVKEALSTFVLYHNFYIVPYILIIYCARKTKDCETGSVIKRIQLKTMKTLIFNTLSEDTIHSITQPKPSWFVQ